MNEMVERVATAIYEQQHGILFDLATDAEKSALRQIARDAIAAMREPTEAMKRAPEVHWGYSCNTCGGLTEGWYAMIDEALK